MYNAFFIKYFLQLNNTWTASMFLILAHDYTIGLNQNQNLKI